MADNIKKIGLAVPAGEEGEYDEVMTKIRMNKRQSAMAKEKGKATGTPFGGDYARPLGESKGAAGEALKMVGGNQPDKSKDKSYLDKDQLKTFRGPVNEE